MLFYVIINRESMDDNNIRYVAKNLIAIGHFSTRGPSCIQHFLNTHFSYRNILAINTGLSIIASAGGFLPALRVYCAG